MRPADTAMDLSRHGAVKQRVKVRSMRSAAWTSIPEPSAIDRWARRASPMNRCLCRVTAMQPEGEGYLLSTVFHAKENVCDVLVLDAQNVDGDPVAVVRAKQRSFGFHGTWVSASQKTLRTYELRHPDAAKLPAFWRCTSMHVIQKHRRLVDTETTDRCSAGLLAVRHSAWKTHHLPSWTCLDRSPLHGTLHSDSQR